jgi:hypothetical protein
MVFERHIVWPDGRREVEGVTPKSLPAPDASHALPNLSDPIIALHWGRGWLCQNFQWKVDASAERCATD